MNPDLFDLVKLFVEERHPNLVVEFWKADMTVTADDQIRISESSITRNGCPTGDSSYYSLISIIDSFVYYVNKNGEYWDRCRLDINHPESFDELDRIIKESVVNKATRKRKKNELQ